MKKVILAVGIALIWFGGTNLGFSATTQVDALVEKLVEKGILNRKEAIQLKAEIAEDEKIVRQEGLKQDLPSWVNNIKFTGDLRTRYQWEEKDGSEERHRGRIRLRFGAEMKVNDELKAFTGFASGGSDPRSTNQTFQDTFQHPDLRLDYAYAEYKPKTWLTLDAGKIKGMPFWTPSDYLWDTDINSEGLAAKFGWAVRPNLNLSLNTGFFVLDESSSDTSDPFMMSLQPGFKWNILESEPEKLSLQTAFTYYIFDNVKGSTLDNSSGTNTLKNSKLEYDYDAISLSSELGVKEPFGSEGIFPYAGIIGEYINNLDPSTDNNGWLIGTKLGYKSVKGKKQWQLRYTYRDLEKDAWLDTFPDSDFYGGGTGVKGHEILLGYGLLKNVNLELDYYHNKNTFGTIKEEDLFQFDVNYKF
jgi:polyhydroxyalkanoate synthesis regulator phasin